MQTLYRYLVTPPFGSPFLAAIRADGNDIEVFTDRGQGWRLDDRVNAADLLLPEFRLYDWDVESW